MAHTTIEEEVRPPSLAARQSGPDARELLQFIGEGFVFLDHDLRIADINSAALKLARRRRSELVGRSLWDVVPSLKNPSESAFWAEALRKRSAFSVERLHRWADGRQSWLEIHGHPTADGFAVFYRDITRRKKSEEAI